MDGILAEACYKLSKVEAQIMMIAQEGVQAYKDSKDYHDEWIKYFTMTYLVGKNEVQSKVAIYFLGLDLTFSLWSWRRMTKNPPPSPGLMRTL